MMKRMEYQTISKSYSEMLTLQTFQERLEYLYIGNGVGQETFGNQRYLNQKFYTSYEWLKCRNDIIVRDMGCELAMEGLELNKRNLLIHHINPITPDDILNRSPKLFDPENLVIVSHNSHNYIHYGKVYLPSYIERSPNDMCPWKGVK